MKRVAIYLRVSTDSQTVENQHLELSTMGERLSWNIVEVLADEGISGAKGRDKRPGYDRLMTMVARKEIDLIACWSVDRLGRSLQHLVGFLGEIKMRAASISTSTRRASTPQPRQGVRCSRCCPCSPSLSAASCENASWQGWPVQRRRESGQGDRRPILPRSKGSNANSARA